MKGIELVMALERYDRHMPFFDGTVRPPSGVSLKVLQVGQAGSLRDGGDRHRRMLRGEFDVAEFSMSSYLMARDRGIQMTAAPVFPRRLFSASGMFVGKDSDLTEPKQLIGKRVALSSFQTTLSLLAKGDLKFEYDAPWEDIHWFVSTDEKVPFTPKPGVRISRVAAGADMGEMLMRGEIDCMIMPHPPHSVMSAKVPTRRLFPDTQQEELRYFREVGFYPIMHVVAIRHEIAERHPDLAREIIRMFDAANRICDSYYEDPNWSRLVWGRHYYERERELIPEAWINGFAANAKNVARFLQYSRDQGLIGESLTPEDLFTGSTLDT